MVGGTESRLKDAIANLLDLRLRYRGNRPAMALVDRCLSLVARAQAADADERRRIDAKVEALRAELCARFGPPSDAVRH